MCDPGYEVKLTRAAVKDLAKFRQWIADIEHALVSLAEDPFVGEPLRGSLSGARSIHLGIRGSGQARIAYVVRQEVRRCVVIAIGTRENFYELAERRFGSLDE